MYYAEQRRIRLRESVYEMKCEPKISRKLTRRHVLKYGAYTGLTCGLSNMLWISGCGRKAGPECPNIVFILIDALRADHLPCYGYGIDTAPNICRLAGQGVTFKRAIAPSSWTKTSMASIWTSKGPAHHGVKGVKDKFPSYLTTLAEGLAADGYHTIGVNTNPWLDSMFGFDAGFDVYRTYRGTNTVFMRAHQVNEQALGILRQTRTRKPVFLYIHYMDVHAPYIPQPPYFSRPPLVVQGLGRLSDARLEFLYRKKGLRGPAIQQRVIDLYHGEIRTADAAVGRLINELNNIRGFENTIFVITADHGEAFLEHGTVAHGRNLYPEVYEVPLLLLWPGHLSAGKQIAAQVRLIDIAPTLFSLAGLTPLDSFDGTDMLVNESLDVQDRIAVCEVGTNDVIPDSDYVAVVSTEYLYVREKFKNKVEFYDLIADPTAKNDLGTSHSKVEFYAKLEEVGSTRGEKQTTELDEQIRRQLESLGYLK